MVPKRYSGLGAADAECSEVVLEGDLRQDADDLRARYRPPVEGSVPVHAPSRLRQWLAEDDAGDRACRRGLAGQPCPYRATRSLLVVADRDQLAPRQRRRIERMAFSQLLQGGLGAGESLPGGDGLVVDGAVGGWQGRQLRLAAACIARRAAAA